jgi:nucleoid-associated protein EbfC
MKGALGQIMQQAQKVQENIKRAQDEIARMEIKVTLDGRHQARKVEINPAALGEDKEFLEDLVAAAINDAAQKLDNATKEKMSAVTGGMGLPPGLNLGL